MIEGWENWRGCLQPCGPANRKPQKLAPCGDLDSDSKFTIEADVTDGGSSDEVIGVDWEIFKLEVGEKCFGPANEMAKVLGINDRTGGDWGKARALPYQELSA